MSTTTDAAVRPTTTPVTRTSTRRALPAWARVPAIWTISLVGGLLLWTYLSWWFGPSIIASPAETVGALVELAANGTLAASIGASSGRILVGWLTGVVIGAPIGILMGRLTFVRDLLDPYVEFFRFVPPIAFVTLTIVWFGIGELSKVALIFYTSVFMVVVSTIQATVSISPLRIQAAQSLGAGRWQLLRTIILPSTIPGIVTGARLAMGNSFLTIVSAEIVAANVGLGSLIWSARNYGRIDWIFAGILVLGTLGFVFDRVLRIVTNRLFHRYGVK
ncbi:ABC transporter permease [Raineyella sp. W15-4]|uniref:ABC transporter permease n=1 Tax=Raineyella sp. W15-4 TaxID=3081651 RepID=UPI002953C785|nr:ABC transporter permease [Raineyella sp. W15-4]WOQ17390.1 ABC transporter permease [Raineyella sp. W15-4]